MSGSDLKEKKEERKYEFDTWLLHLPPINLYNVDLVCLAFGYDTKWNLKQKEINE